MRARNASLLAAVSLATVAGCPLTESMPIVDIETSLGTFAVELNTIAAPLSAANFRQYVDDAFYDGVIFHRVVAGFVVQSGGFEPGFVEKDTRDPIPDESANGLLNLRGTLGLARTSDPNSATSQFYVNLVDNPSLDPQNGTPGFTVFGRVVEGMDVVDAIGALETETVDEFADVPVEQVTIISARLRPPQVMLDPVFEQQLETQTLTTVRTLIVNLLGFALEQAFAGGS